MSSLLPFPASASDDAASRLSAPRLPPQNSEAEQTLLGAILLNNKAYERVSDYLRPIHFAEAAHQFLFAAMQNLLDRGLSVDPISLKAPCDQEETLRLLGGSQYLHTLAESVLSITNVGDYGKLVHDMYLRRELIAVGEDVVNSAFSASLDLEAKLQIEVAEKRLFDLATVGDVEGGFKNFGISVSEALKGIERAYHLGGGLSGLSTGFADLDRLLGGLHDSDLLIVAGRPSMGKTAFATNMAFHIAEHFKPAVDDQGVIKKDAHPTAGGVVGFFSLEMSAEQLAGRILAESCNIPSEKLRTGSLEQHEFDRLVASVEHLKKIPLHIDDTPAITVTALRSRARRLKRQHGLHLIVIDYLQLMRPPAGFKNESRVQEVSEITRGLKAIAKELNVPVIALSQLSRAVESRDDKRPQLADLRESGSIEQDADAVMFVFRAEYYVGREEPVMDADEAKYQQDIQVWQERLEKVKNKAEIIIAKQRHGPIGKVELQFDGATTRFSNLARTEYLPNHR